MKTDWLSVDVGRVVNTYKYTIILEYIASFFFFLEVGGGGVKPFSFPLMLMVGPYVWRLVQCYI